MGNLARPRNVCPTRLRASRATGRMAVAGIGGRFLCNWPLAGIFAAGSRLAGTALLRHRAASAAAWSIAPAMVSRVVLGLSGAHARLAVECNPGPAQEGRVDDCCADPLLGRPADCR